MQNIVHVIMLCLQRSHQTARPHRRLASAWHRLNETHVTQIQATQQLPKQRTLTGCNNHNSTHLLADSDINMSTCTVHSVLASFHTSRILYQHSESRVTAAEVKHTFFEIDLHSCGNDFWPAAALDAAADDGWAGIVCVLMRDILIVSTEIYQRNISRRRIQEKRKRASEFSTQS